MNNRNILVFGVLFTLVVGGGAFAYSKTVDQQNAVNHTTDSTSTVTTSTMNTQDDKIDHTTDPLDLVKYVANTLSNINNQQTSVQKKLDSLKSNGYLTDQFYKQFTNTKTDETFKKLHVTNEKLINFDVTNKGKLKNDDSIYYVQTSEIIQLTTSDGKTHDITQKGNWRLQYSAEHYKLDSYAVFDSKVQK